MNASCTALLAPASFLRRVRRRLSLGGMGLVLAVSAAFASEPSPAAAPGLLFHDAIAYPTGTLPETSGGLWKTRNAQTHDPVAVVAGSLRYADLQTSGNHLRLTQGALWAASAMRPFPTVDHRLIWGSFLLKINHIPAEAHRDGIELTLGGVDNPDFGFSISVEGPQLDAHLHLRDSLLGPVSGDDAPLLVGRTHLLVFQYNAADIPQGGLEPGMLALYVDPPLGITPELGTARLVTSGYLIPGFGHLALFARQCDAEVDEFRLGATFEAVTPLIAPTTPGTFVEVAALTLPPAPVSVRSLALSPSS